MTSSHRWLERCLPLLSLLGAQGSAPPGSVWLILHLHGVGGELLHHKCLSSTCYRPYEGSKGGGRKTPYVTRSMISLCDANFFCFRIISLWNAS